MWVWGPVAYPTARASATWLCALWGRHEGAQGGGPLPGCEASGVEHSSTPHRPSLRQGAGARYPLAVGAGCVDVVTPDQPHCARSCALALRTVGAARGRPAGAPVA